MGPAGTPGADGSDGQDGTTTPPVDPPVDPPMETMEITMGGMGSWSDDGQDYVFHGTWPEDATWQYMLDEWDVIFVGPDWPPAVEGYAILQDRVLDILQQVQHNSKCLCCM